MKPVARILGTPIFAVAPATADERVLLFSDLHLSPATVAVTERMAATLRAARGRGVRRVFILGDLFEFWIGPGQARVPGFVPIVDVLRSAVASGLELAVLHGNRDFLLGPAFTRATGVRVVPGGLRLQSGARTFVLLHGDETCLNDVPYQRSKPWLRSWPLRLLSLVMPVRLALRIGEFARRKSMATVATGPADPARFLPTGAAYAAVFAGGATDLVMGHIHRPACGELAAGPVHGRYFVLPAFDEVPRSIEIRDGAVCYRDPDGREVDGYGPLPLT